MLMYVGGVVLLRNFYGLSGQSTKKRVQNSKKTVHNLPFYKARAIARVTTNF
jgi:hypothetical protein